MADRPASRRRGDARNQRRGTLLDSLPRTPAAPRSPDAPGRSGVRPAEQAPDDSGWRTGKHETPGRLTLPSMPRMPARRNRRAPAPHFDDWENAVVEADDYDQEYSAAPASSAPANLYDGRYDARYEADYEGDFGDQYPDEYANDGWEYETRSRARSLARPLTPALPQYNDPDDAQLPIYPPLPADSAPMLAAYRPAPVPRRIRLDTRALAQSAAQTARNPWTIVRLALAITAMALALMHAPGQMGEQSQPLMTAQAQAGLAPGGAITSLVKPETQLLRPDLYDNYAQFQNWGGAACSAAAISEILTAYGVPHATIGHEIDELGSYISPNGGLLNRHGFAVVAAKHNLRADESTSLTYNQIIYLSEQLGMPVIVNVRMSYGYYHFFDGGHFLTVVGGDAQGLKIVDSSEYYIHYLPKDVFYQMFTGYTAAIVPGDYQYTLPPN